MLRFTGVLTSRILVARMSLVDDDLPRLEPPPRQCPDCQTSMLVPHDGVFATLYVCPRCGLRVTIPPKTPLVIEREEQ